MIICPACRHEEVEGEFFCTNCGMRLDGPRVEAPITYAYDPKRLGDPTRPAAAPPTRSLTDVPPGHVLIQVKGATNPLLLRARAEYLLGRAGHEKVFPDVNLDPYQGRELGVSRAHAMLRIVHQQMVLIDLGSTNGTRLNGKAVSAHEPVPVENGDEIRLGKLPMQVYFNL